MASGRVAYLNGAFVPETEAKITLFDSQNHMGDMVHENTRTFGHRPFKLREHMERLYYSMAAVEIDCGFSIEQMEEVTLELLSRNEHTLAPEEDCFFIHDVSGGPHEYYAEVFSEGLGPVIGIYVWPLTKILANRARLYESGVNAVIPRQRHVPTRFIDPKVKSRSRLHYQMAELEMKHWGPDAWAILLDEDGFLTEGTAANFLLVKDGGLLSPEPRNILRGVTRQTVIEMAERTGIGFVEKNLEPYDILTADEAFFTTTSIFMMPATRFNGRPIGDGGVGPVYRRLANAFVESIGVDFIEQARLCAERLGVDWQSPQQEHGD